MVDTKAANQNVVIKPKAKTPAEIEEEAKLEERARRANERAAAFLKNRNNAQ